jgi:hypothetical protein
MFFLMVSNTQSRTALRPITEYPTAENVKLEPEVIARYGRWDSGVTLPEENGYVRTLNVYHELHCLKRHHQYIYQEYYWSNLDDQQREINRLHNSKFYSLLMMTSDVCLLRNRPADRLAVHCADFLRRVPMCHSSIGLITFKWIPENRIPVPKLLLLQ